MSSSHHEKNQILDVFRHSLKALGATPDDLSLVKLSNLIDKSMSNERRYFHRISHILELIDLNDPILSLAALFHDLVYYQVDQALPTLASHLLKPMVHENGLDLVLSDDCLKIRPDLEIVCNLFEVKPGQTLNPAKGLNEFLSAIVAYESLAPFLDHQDLIQICVCIEATIPFRASHNGISSMSAVEKILRQGEKQTKVRFDETTIVKAIQRATNLANRDVQNFATSDPALFLASTWLLLPERNESLRDDYYTFKDYRISLQKMQGFFGFLSGDIVFKQYRGFPDNTTHKMRTSAADNNIQISRRYLNIKVIAISLLEALANSTGCDLPISMMLGRVQKNGKAHLRMEDFLPPPPKLAPTDPVIMRLLQDGRAADASFDLRNSPLAAFIYQQLGDKGIETLVEASHKFFAGEIESAEYLEFFPTTVLSPVANACAQVFPSRVNELKKHIA